MKNILSILFLLSIVVISGCGSDDSAPAVSFEEQLAIDIEIIDDYLNDNDINAEIHESGIRYVIEEDGDGEYVELGNEIMVRFVSYYLDGTNAGGDTIGFSTVVAEPIIEAWTLMVPEMREGGKMTIYPPSGYLFGPEGLGDIVPPNTIIVYEIEVIAIVNDAADRLDLEGQIIDEYLQENGINAETHASGIRYTVLEEGTGASPNVNSNVRVTYAGTFLSGVVFDAPEGERSFILAQVIESWQIMIPTMKEGGRIKFYAPSSLCYGTTGTQTIAPNTVLVFEVELVLIN